MKKRILCAILAVCVMVSATVPAFALETDAAKERVMLDSYSAEHYEIATYREDGVFYVITLLDDGQVELVVAEEGGEARTLWFNVAEIEDIEIELSSSCFVNAVIEYGAINWDESFLVESVGIGEASCEDMFVGEVAETNNYHVADYDKLMEKLRIRYGEKHSNYDWTGMTSQTYGGLVYKYKENLTYDMLYRDYVAYSEGMSLGSLLLGISNRLGLTPKLSTLAGVLGLSASATALLPGDGILASYGGDVVFCRFVMIQGGGPYYQCYKNVEYDGWVNREEGTGEIKVTLEYVGERYSATSKIFSDYTLQRTLAYENYA